MKLTLKILILVILLPLAGCKWFTTASLPLFMGLDVRTPDGTPAFQMGYKHGCSNVLYARSNVLYRNTRHYQYDPKMIGNAEYRLGVSRGYTFCFQNIIGPAPMSSFDRYLAPFAGPGTSGYGVFDTTVDSGGGIGGMWGGMFATPAPSVINVPYGGMDSLFNLLGGGGGEGSVLTANPLWAGGSKGQIFGQ